MQVRISTHLSQRTRQGWGNRWIPTTKLLRDVEERPFRAALKRAERGTRRSSAALPREKILILRQLLHG